MPTLSRFLARAGFAYLVAAMILGFLLPALHVAEPVYRASWTHLLVLGWLTQLIFAVAHWMFPRYSAARPRGHEPLGWTGFGLLNAGLLLRVVSEPGWHLGRGMGALLVVAAILQALGVLVFIAHLWPRTRAR